MTSPQGTPSNVLLPLSLGRLWATAAWALSLGVLTAALLWAEGDFTRRAAGQVMLLLPATQPEEAQQAQLRQELMSEPGVNDARWISPRQLVQRVGRQYDTKGWEGLIGEDEGWMPWVMEVEMTRPLDQGAQIQAFIARRTQDSQWKMILWDTDWLLRTIAVRTAVRAMAGLWLVLSFVMGLALLLRLPWPRQGGGWLWAWSLLLGAGGPAAVWAAGWMAGCPRLDAESLAVALGTGAVLAGVLAPLLRPRVQHRPLPPAPPIEPNQAPPKPNAPRIDLNV